MGHVISRTRSAVSLAFSPDEQRLAMDSGEGTVTLWDLRTNRPLATYRGHDAGPIQALAFSPDGKQLRSLGFEGYVKTWETTRTPERRAFEEIRGVSRRLGALSPDGGLVAMVGSGVYVRDANTGKELWKFIPERGQGPAFYMAAFSPDGRYLAAGSSAGRFPDGNGPVWVWEAKTGKLVWNLPELEQRAELATFAVAFSPDGKRLASGGEGGAVHLWDVATGKELRKLPGHSMSVTSLEFSRDGRRLLAASGSLPTRATRDFGFGRSRKPDDPEDVPDLKVWDLGTGKEVLTLGLKGLLIAALSPDGTTVAVVCDRTARLYDVATSKETLVLKGVTAIGSEDHNLRGGGRSRTSPSAPTASGLSPPVLTVGDASVGASLSSCGTRRPGKRS
jgi:WD40 repeat protein